MALPKLRKKAKTPSVSPYLTEQADGILQALGGKENVANLTACITRLRATLHDREKVQLAELLKLGSKENILIEDNQLHILLGKSADSLLQLIKPKLA